MTRDIGVAFSESEGKGLDPSMVRNRDKKSAKIHCVAVAGIRRDGYSGIFGHMLNCDRSPHKSDADVATPIVLMNDDFVPPDLEAVEEVRNQRKP